MYESTLTVFRCYRVETGVLNSIKGAGVTCIMHFNFMSEFSTTQLGNLKEERERETRQNLVSEI